MIKFKYMTKSDLKIWHEWVDLPHVKDTWFIQGYEPPTVDPGAKKIIDDGIKVVIDKLGSLVKLRC